MQLHGSHTVLLVRDMEERIEFQFMHCNNRDHSIASGAATKKRINHLIFEFEELDDVGLALEII